MLMTRTLDALDAWPPGRNERAKVVFAMASLPLTGAGGYCGHGVVGEGTPSSKRPRNRWTIRA